MTKPAIKSISFRAPPALAAWLQSQADASKASMGATVRALLEAAMEGPSEPPVTLAETPNPARLADQPTRECPTCNGAGQVRGWSHGVMAMIQCTRCAGTGRVLA